VEVPVVQLVETMMVVSVDKAGLMQLKLSALQLAVEDGYNLQMLLFQLAKVVVQVLRLQ
jgi:hypothetical protein